MSEPNPPDPTTAASSPPSLDVAAKFLLGLFLVLGVGPLLVWAAFSAHEPRCEDAEVFWTGDLPTGAGPVGGVILGSSSMGMDLDVYALSHATGSAWQRIARHAIEQSSVPASYPRMLSSSDATPGLATLILEVSPSLFDQTSCARPELAGLPMRLAWAPAARRMLGDDAELTPAIAMGWLPHRWIMTSGRRSDIISHLKRPAHAVQLLTDLPNFLSGRRPPSRWKGEAAPELTPERALRRREFLLGGPLNTWVPVVSDACMGTLERVITEAHADQTVLIIPPLRAVLQATFPDGYLTKLTDAAHAVAARTDHTVVLDAKDRFKEDEDRNFLDFDHLNETGTAAFTADVLTLLRR